MGLNLLLDALLGLVPFVGDLLDVAYRANRANLRLLEHALSAEPVRRPPTVGYVLTAVVLVVVPLLIGIAVAAAVLWLLVSRLRS